MDNDYLYDHALQQFTDTGTCSKIFFVFGQSSSDICSQSNELARRILHTIMWCVIKANNEDIQTLRIIFENFLNLVKSLNEITTNKELQTMTDQYFEDVLEFYQILAQEENDSDTLEELLNNLNLKTKSFIERYRSQLKSPLLLDIYEDYQRRLQEKLNTDSSTDSTEEECCSTAAVLPKLPGSNLDHTLSEEIKSVAESTASESDIISLHIDENSNASDILAENSHCDSPDKDKTLHSQATNIPLEQNPTEQSDVNEEINETAEINAGNENDYEDNRSAHGENSIRNPERSFSGLDLGRSPKKKKKLRNAFSLQSDAMLLHGVQSYGVGHWKEILNNYNFPSFRNSVHLKDRWRTLLHSDVVSFMDGRVKILRQQQADVFQKLTEEIKARRERSVPVIRLTPLSKDATTSISQPIKHSTPVSSPVLSLSDSENESKELASNNKPRVKASTQQSSKERKINKRRRRRLWHVEGEAVEWEDDSILKPNFTSFKSALKKKTSKTPSRRHKKKPWTSSEVSNLINGLRRFGIGQWSMILDQYEFSNRNPVMLKDKYRNMLKNNELPKDLQSSNKT